MPDPLLSVHALTAGHGSRAVFEELSFVLPPGSFTAVVGPNGSGKTTLLHTITGIHPATRGEVRIDGADLAGLSRREIARRVALVPQSVQIDFEVTVEDAIALGRYPWLGAIAPFGPRDEAAVEAAVRSMDLTALRGRGLQTLSGGERQRVFLARALAQETPLLLLDEPAAGLDLRYQQEIFTRLGELAAARRMAILVADHHLNLVSAMCDRLLVLHRGGLRADGPPEEIVTEEMLRTVFGARMRVRRENGGRPQCVWDA